VLIPAYGVVGAAVATVITVSVLVGVELFVVVRELPLSATALAYDTGRAGVITAVMSGVVLALLPYVSGLGTLAALVGAGLGVWAVLATLSGVIDPVEVRAVLG